MRKINWALCLYGFISLNLHAESTMNTPSNPQQVTDCKQLQSLARLQGSWQSLSKDAAIIEHWQQVSLNTLEGSANKTRLSDNLLIDSESLRLVSMNQNIFYLAKVDHNRLPVAFELTDCSQNHYIFTNPAHDFPQKIRYDFNSPESMTVTVSDLTGGGFKLDFKKQQSHGK